MIGRARAWARKKWPRPVARATSRARMAPSFLVIGEMKCGTTSFFSYLTRHPGVLAPWKKELWYFDAHYERGESWYRSNFPLERAGEPFRRSTGIPAITGEATAYYMFHPLARHRVHEFDPDMRLIALLRDPVERASSHYHHSHSKGRDPLTFEQALDAEEDRLRGETERILLEPSYSRFGETPYRSFAHINYSYLARGRYAEQLEAWLELFPREQLLVLRAEDLFERPGDAVEEAIAFLGLPHADLGEYPVLNTRTYEAMPPETRSRLAAYFEEPNRRLYELLGRDLDWTRPTRSEEPVAVR